MKTKEELEKEKADFEASLEGLSEEEKAQKLEEKVKAEELLKHNTEVEEELRVEREKRVEAERKFEETRQKAKEAFEKRQKERDESGDDKPLTEDAVRRMLEEGQETTRKEMREEQALEIAKRLSESETEARLVIEVWKNRKLQGTLAEQIEEAHAISASKRIKAQNEELKRAISGDATGDGLNAQRKPAQAGEPKIDVNDKSVLAEMVWDNAKGAYKKVIAGGTRMFYVSRDLKRRWTEQIGKK